MTCRGYKMVPLNPTPTIMKDLGCLIKGKQISRSIMCFDTQLLETSRSFCTSLELKSKHSTLAVAAVLYAKEGSTKRLHAYHIVIYVLYTVHDTHAASPTGQR